MDGFIVSQARDGDRVTWYNVATGVEVVIDGGEPRRHLAERVLADLKSLSRQATHLLESFMKDRGEFDLSTVDVLPAKSEDGSDFSLRYDFTADRAPHEYDYTYFDVFFSEHEPPAPRFWPHKFTVGFH